MPRRLYILPLLLALPLTCGCLTTLAISALAGSGSGGEQMETVKNTARNVAVGARDAADDISLSAQDAFDSLTTSSN
jgi:hypothetical protein